MKEKVSRRKCAQTCLSRSLPPKPGVPDSDCQSRNVLLRDTTVGCGSSRNRPSAPRRSCGFLYEKGAPFLESLCQKFWWLMTNATSTTRFVELWETRTPTAQAYTHN